MYAIGGQGVQTSFRAGPRYRVLTTYPDSTELIEEYDAVTQNLECRRWRSPRPLGGMGDWEYEIGDAVPVLSRSNKTPFLCTSSTSMNPSFHPRDSRTAWEWLVRNAPYPAEVYSVSVDGQKQALVLRTKNRKYFKIFKVPTLVRAGLSLEQCRVSISHDGCTTLKISYAKPDTVLDAERKARASARTTTT